MSIPKALPTAVKVDREFLEGFHLAGNFHDAEIDKVGPVQGQTLTLPLYAIYFGRTYNYDWQGFREGVFRFHLPAGCELDFKPEVLSDETIMELNLGERGALLWTRWRSFEWSYADVEFEFLRGE